MQPLIILSSHQFPAILYSHKKNRGDPKATAAFCLSSTDWKLAVDFLHVSDEIEHFVRVTDFIVIPADNLNEGRSELDTCLSVEDRGEGAAEEVA